MFRLPVLRSWLICGVIVGLVAVMLVAATAYPIAAAGINPQPPRHASAPTALATPAPQPPSHINTAPYQSTSYYVQDITPSAIQQLGYDEGTNNLAVSHGVASQPVLVILNFGQPYCNASPDCTNAPDQYGTAIFDNDNTIVTMPQITAAMEAYAIGYESGLTAGGTRPRPAGAPVLTLIAGTSNYANLANYAGHSAAWANMLVTVSTYLITQGNGTNVGGGDDIETGFSPWPLTQEWVTGFTTATNPNSHAPDNWLFVDYGDADCPTTSYSATGTCGHGWTQDNIDAVSARAAIAIPLPEVYAESGDNAREWEEIALYHYVTDHATMRFLGPLSQHGACQQRTCTQGTNNTPAQAYQQLDHQLNHDSSNHDPNYPRIAYGLIYESDIKYQIG